MIPRYQLLGRRIAGEMSELEQTQATIQRHWVKAETVTADQDAFLNSVALNLHALYSGLERVFELIAVELDGGTIGGDAWHAELLRQMSFNVPGIRPAVLRPETAAALDELRRFRHRIRHIYATTLDPARVKPLVVGLPDLWDHLKQELAVFVSFLDDLAQGGTEP